MESGGSVKWASELTDRELITELRQRHLDADEFFASDDHDRSGSPGEGLFERLDELQREYDKRKLINQSVDI